MKNKLNYKLFGFLLLFILVFSFCSISTLADSKTCGYNNMELSETYDSNNIAGALESYQNDLVYNNEIEQDSHCFEYIQLNFEEKPYLLSETAYLNFSIVSLNQVEDIQYKCVGFDILKPNIVVNCSIKVGVKFNENKDAMSFKLIVNLSNGNILVSNVYGYQSNGFYFLSRASEENKDLLYYDYALRTNLISNEEYEEILLEKSCLAEENVDFSNEINKTPLFNSNNQVSMLAYEPIEAYVSGNWQWHDGNNYHPLKNTLVNISYPRNAPGDSAYVSCSTYTDENGNFSATLWIAEPVEVQVQVRSEGKTTLVRKNSLSSSYSSTTPSKTLNPGGSVSFNYYLPNTSTTFKAFQVCQALIMGGRYVEAMTGTSTPKATCHFPKDSNQFSSFWNAIDITEEAHNYWDIILHEYGHKLQHHFKIEDSPSEEHIINEDLIAKHNKDKGIRLAWGEGWPTFFSILVTQYFGDELINIRQINDSAYHSYSYDNDGNFYEWNSSLESISVIGEGCEAAVFAVLYDLYDSYSTNEPWDNLSFSHSTMFNAVINSGAKTFSSFLNYFITNYCNANDGRIGNILSHYGMSSTDLRVTSGVLSYSTPPTFSWNAGGPESCRYNDFELIFYNQNDSIILQTNRQSSTSTTLTADQWAQILSSTGTNITVAVVSYQTDKPSTGAYYSQKLTLIKPKVDNPEIPLNMSVSSRYEERKIILSSGQYYDYLFTCSASGTKLIQTFGTKDTKIELYSSSGTLLKSNDDDGYNLNALILYYFNADITYKIRVKFFSSSSYGTTKLAITPAYAVYNVDVTLINKYEDIYSVTGKDSFTFSTYAQQGYTRVITFTPPSSAKYTFTIESDFDTYIYVIDPRSNELIVFNIDYNDDGGEDMNPLLTRELEANIPYLIIYSAYNPYFLNETKDITLRIKKN